MPDVNVVVGADSSPLSAGLAKAKESVNSFKEQAQDSFRELALEFAAVFAAGAILEGLHSVFLSNSTGLEN